MEAQKEEAMTGREQGGGSRTGNKGRYLAFAAALLLFAGCAAGKGTGTGTGELAGPMPATGEPARSLPTRPSVVHFTDGREGFAIYEPSNMNAQLRAEFDAANAMIKATQYEKAIELLEKIVAQSPEMTAPHINLGMAYRQVDKPEQAEQHLKKALELIPGHPVASNEYGLLLRKAGRFAEGRAIYENALTLFPEYRPIRKNLGILCDLYLQDLACALEHYDIYSKGTPKDEQVKLWLGDLHTRLGH